MEQVLSPPGARIQCAKEKEQWLEVDTDQKSLDSLSPIPQVLESTQLTASVILAIWEEKAPGTSNLVNPRAKPSPWRHLVALPHLPGDVFLSRFLR